MKNLAVAFMVGVAVLGGVGALTTAYHKPAKTELGTRIDLSQVMRVNTTDVLVSHPYNSAFMAN
jgi:hypothetical protein